MSIKDPYLNLLALSACFNQNRVSSQPFINACSQVNRWEIIPTIAEEHGVAPLLYFQIRNLKINLSHEINQILKALALRHRLINRIHSQQIQEISTQMELAGIQAVFLKGAALSHMLYSEPGLRPMSDIDLLVSRSDLQTALGCITRLGYSGAEAGFDVDASRHLPMLFKTIEGFDIHVELHYALFQDKNAQPWFEIKDLCSPLQIFSIEDETPCTALGHEDMLFHLCQHAFYNNCGFDSTRLIWVADIINYAEAFYRQINWNMVRLIYPSVIHTLQMLDDLVPFSSELKQMIPLNKDHIPHQIEFEYKGWPTLPVAAWKSDGIRNLLFHSLFPSAWWLELHYGRNKESPLWYYWGHHIHNLVWAFRDRMPK